MININMANGSVKTENVINWTIRIGSFVMSIAIMISSWFLTQAWDKISNVEKEVTKLQIVTATMEGNRFSSKDWSDAKSVLDGERLVLDRRIIRLEESIPVIKDSLIEIKQTLKKQNE